MSSKTEFKVTDKAGAFVAGVRSPGVNESVWLTDEQADFALSTGELVRVPAKKPVKPAPSPEGA